MEMIALIKCFNIKHGDVVSVVGAGGKSSLIAYLASVLSGKTIIMPSTKMYQPQECWPLQLNKRIEWLGNTETIVTAEHMSRGKLSGINPRVFEGQYDHVLIEADGSKGRALKGWRSDEPVIVDETTLTLAIMDMTTIGMPINPSTVHRLELFQQLTTLNKWVTLESLSDVICHPKGLFKGSRGKRILFLNKVESDQLMENAMALCDLINKREDKVFDQVVIGSVKHALGYTKR